MAADLDAYQVVVSGALITSVWRDLAEGLLPATLRRLRDLDLAPLRCEVSVVLVDEDEIQRLNRDYRGVDAPTDVLSFSQLEGSGPDWSQLPADAPILLGDIVIAVPRMRAQAVEYGHSEAREMGFLLVHGLLHLLGFDHEAPDDALAMRAAEEDVLAAAGLTRGDAG